MQMYRGRRDMNGVKIDGTYLNGMIQGASQRAYDKLDVTEKYYVRKVRDQFMDTCAEIGEKGALELTAAICDVICGGE
jgi:hypothetical protein